MSATLLFVLWCWSLLWNASNSITTITNIWIDDFLFDPNGIYGWSNNMMTVGNNGTKYHGFYGGGSNFLPSLNRHFKCNKLSHIEISFILYYACDVGGDVGVKFHFNNNEKEEFYLRFDDEQNKPYHVNTNKQNKQFPICQFKAQFMNYSMHNIIVNALEIFNINFIFQLSAGRTNQFEALSNIIIICQATEESQTNNDKISLGPTYVPTYNPTMEPTSFVDVNRNQHNNKDNESEKSELNYLLSWWGDKRNWGWKAFIIVGVLCALIGCIVIVCIVAYFEPNRKPISIQLQSVNETKPIKISITDNKDGTNDDNEDDIPIKQEVNKVFRKRSSSLEYKSLYILPQQLNISNLNHIPISRNNNRLKLPQESSDRYPQTIKRQKIRTKSQEIIDRFHHPNNSYDTKSNPSSSSSSYCCSCSCSCSPSSSSSISSYSCSCSNSSSYSESAFATQTVSQSSLKTTIISADTFSESTIKTARDHREYHKKYKRYKYKYDYNDDMELREIDEHNQTESHHSQSQDTQETNDDGEDHREW